MVWFWASRRTTWRSRPARRAGPGGRWPSFVSIDMDRVLRVDRRATARGCGRAARAWCTSAPIASRSGPSSTPAPPMRWHDLHWVADSAKNQSRPRPASPVRPRIASGSIASPSRTTRSASGTKRSNRSRTSAPGMVPGPGDDRAERRPGDRARVDQPHQRQGLAGRAGQVADRLGLRRPARPGRASGEVAGRAPASRPPGSAAIQSAISRVAALVDAAASRAGASGRRRSWRSGSRGPSARARPGR